MSIVNELRELLQSPRGVGEETRRQLLRAVMIAPGTQVSLSIRTGISTGGVSNVVRDLQSAGLVRVSSEGKQKIVSMAPTSGVATGVSLGYQRSVVVARRVDQPFSQARFRLLPVGVSMRTPNAWIDEVADSLLDLAREIDGDVGQLTTIGLALPHSVDPRSGRLKPPLTSPWDEIPDPAWLIADRLSARLPGLKAPLLVIMDNDANLGALAESTYNLTGTETLIYVQTSEGIGAGIIIGGRMFRGATGGAGELGHLVVEAGGRFCSCGKQGCLEAVIGAEALLDRARTAVGRRPAASPATLDDLVIKASQGDLVCQGVLRNASHRLGLALGGICNILNPKVVIIGGAFGDPSASPFTLDSCKSAIGSSALEANTDNDFRLSVSQIAHAPAHGALILGLSGTSF